MKKEISIIFGNMNPPKPEHKILVDSALEDGKNLAIIVMNSNSDVLKSAKSFFGKVKVLDLSTKNLSETLEKLKELGYEKINLIVSDDKTENFKDHISNDVTIFSYSLKNKNVEKNFDGNKLNRLIKKSRDKKNKSGIDDAHDTLIIQYKLKSNNKILITSQFKTRKDAINFYEKTLEGKTSKVVFYNKTKDIYYDLNYNQTKPLIGNNVQENNMFDTKIQKWIDHNKQSYSEKYGERGEKVLLEQAKNIQKDLDFKQMNEHYDMLAKCFISLLPTQKTQKDLFLWAKSLGYDLSLSHEGKVIDPMFFDFHITISYAVSTLGTPVLQNLSVEGQEKIEPILVEPQSYQMFGESIPVIVLKNNDTILNIKNFYEDVYGLVSLSQYEFTPHISLSYGTTTIISNDLPNFPLIFDKIYYKTDPLFGTEDNNSNISESLIESEYQGKKVELNKPFRLQDDSKKKFGVYVKNDNGNVILVKFGDANMSIKRDDPERRKSFRARHDCENKKDKTKAGYWSCKFWSSKKVSDLV